MRQLVQLQQHAEQFKNLNAELIFIFREESEGVDGLKKIKEKHDSPYTLSLDLDSKSTESYSSAPKTFDNYVVDSKGNVRGIIDGTLRDRATAEELIKVLKQVQEEAH